MSAAVRFHRVGAEYVVSFKYDETIIAVIKSLPVGTRRWDKPARVWRIDANYGRSLAASLRELDYVVVGLTAPTHRAEISDADWARVLFRRVGGMRSERVFRALCKVLHPDNIATGDTELMKELLAARAELTGGDR